MKITWLELAACILHSLSMSILKKTPVQTLITLLTPFLLICNIHQYGKFYINTSKYGTAQHKPTPKFAE